MHTPPEPAMPPSTIIPRIRQFIPPLLSSFHKGQQGRVAVIGGCEDYTGAPYFSAQASALLGADLSHVICEPQAAQVIKTYSPNLMVHPYLRSGTGSADEVVARVTGLLERLHAIVVGPGLGRDPLMQECARRILEEAKRKEMPVVVDADGLFLVQNCPAVVHGYRRAVLTPNVMEFARLCKVQGVDPAEGAKEEVCSRLARSFGGVTIVQKGPVDYISNGDTTLVCDIEGGLKRSGGQGDTLTGALVTFLAWGKAYREKMWEHDDSLSDEELMALAAYGACAVTRTCSRLAFKKRGRSMQASDLSEQVEVAFFTLFGERAEGKL